MRMSKRLSYIVISQTKGSVPIQFGGNEFSTLPYSSSLPPTLPLCSLLSMLSTLSFNKASFVSPSSPGRSQVVCNNIHLIV